MSDIYQIRLQGHLSQRWAIRFEDFSIKLEDSGETILTGQVIDQAALHGLLRDIRDLGLTLISVEQLPVSTQKENNMSKGAKQMKVIVFGATGTTGSAVVERALELGYEVTAFVRTPSKVTTQHPNLSIAQGDVLDAASVEQAVEGHDAVISSLGAGLNGTIRSEGTRNIIRAMEKAGVRRFISQSSLGVGDSRSNLNAYWKYFMFGMLLRRAYADHGLQEDYIRQSNLDWTIVRPGALKEGELTGDYRHGFSPTNRDITLEISIADTADFMVKQLKDSRYLHSTPGLSY